MADTSPLPPKLDDLPVNVRPAPHKSPPTLPSATSSTIRGSRFKLIAQCSPQARAHH